jgi:D-glycero-alpha-D-manno-heptose 1-phosphate guanylyltransferase
VQALVLVGGLGTRLRSVVPDRPKPMARVAGRPFLEWVLISLRAEGVSSVVFCSGVGADQIEEYFGDGSAWGVRVTYSREQASLGTGGALRNAVGYVTQTPVLVANGDTISCPDLARLLKVHSTYCSRATLWAVEVPDCSRYGSVECGPSGRIEAFREKDVSRAPGFINAGAMLLEREEIVRIPEGCQTSLEVDVLPTLVERGVYAVAGRAPFLDIGTPESYRVADQFIAGLRRSGLLPAVPSLAPQT